MDISAISNTFWDYIFVGGGLSASVVSHRLHQFNNQFKILIVEAGPDANNRSDIVWPNSTNLIGGDFDWKYDSVKQSKLDGRVVNLPNGKALGGGTVINQSGWVRGDKYDYDLWGTIVGDPRWSYNGLLPFMKKSESFWSNTINTDQHGFDGPAAIQSVTSTKREFPLREYALRSWSELGIDALPGLDANAGNPLGVGELQENKNKGRREIAAAIYPLGNITVLTDTLVEKVLIKSEADGHSATGVRLADGTEIHGREITLSAGAIRSPQILMLSGVGPADELKKANIQVLLNQPEVGKNLCDHGLFIHAWKLKDPSAGWALGSGNPLFNQEQYGWGGPMDFLASTDIPKEGLAAAIAEDEGCTPDPASHQLLDKRTFAEHVFMYAGAPDGSLVTFALVTMLPTSRGSVKLASGNISDAPLIDPNFLGTAVDRYAAREALKLQIKFAGSNLTAVGRDIIEGEAGAPGFDEVLSINSTDSYIDARLRAGIGSSYHPMGTLAMGKVVDADLKVKGVSNLRVVDTSVFPVPLTGHLQVPTYATAEQAAEIIYNSRSKTAQ
ncbi:putative GMC oxidoreductase [Hypomontagnella monticulosa]|nr:putative GMC oxidoreductase [Hypomontagnella monticulosa]